MSIHLIKKFLFAAISIFMLLGFNSCGDTENDDTDWEIKYEVIVQDSYNWNTIYEIEYIDSTNNLVRVDDSPESPWTQTFNTDQADFSIYILGVPMMCDGSCTDFSTTVTVSVYINNVLYKTQTGSDEAEIVDNLDNLLANGPE